MNEATYVGSTSWCTDDEIIKELRRIACNENFDAQPDLELSSEAIDLGVIQSDA